MANDRFLIAPIKSGLKTNLKPWLISDNAFAKLKNAYMHEGRIRKRFGSTFTGTGASSSLTQPLNSRLRIALAGGAGVGITDGAGAATGTVPGSIFKIGQMFSIDDEIFTVYQTGTPAVMYTTGAATTLTFDTTTGAYVFNGAGATKQVYFYPAEPVMGITNLETNSLNNNPALSFDTQFAYQYAGTAWQAVGPTAGSQFNGTNYEFFKACNWNGITSDLNLLFVTNFNATVPAAATDDPMWYYNGTAFTGWTQFQPIFIVGANFVRSARIILPFKDRLILLNTVENDGGGGLGVNTAYSNRCRFSHNGSPVAASAYYEPNQVGFTGGGWIDAATKEEIISAEYIKDRLIVYFEKSTWELAYTGNSVQPFLWQKINTELGSESALSSVPFDQAILTVGTTGIHACNGANVIRIDEDIETQIFEIRNDNNGPERVAGIRDYFVETVYWTFPESKADRYAITYPSKVLVYNYKYKNWALNDDSITAFGFFEQQTGMTWGNSNIVWEEAGFPWGSGTTQAKFRQIIAGNQQGFIFKVEPNVTSNERALQVTDIAAGVGSAVLLTIVDHNLYVGDYIEITNCQGVTGLNDQIYQVTPTSTSIVSVQQGSFAGTYTGGGTAARVSKIEIDTKRFNPYIGDARNVSIDSVDFAVQKTASGQITVDYTPSSSNISIVADGTTSGVNLGDNVLQTYAYDLVPLESTQELLWHRVYFGVDGDSVQLKLYLSDEQMLDPEISQSNFVLEGFILNMSGKGRMN